VERYRARVQQKTIEGNLVGQEPWSCPFLSSRRDSNTFLPTLLEKSAKKY
jgi:hypothetical protein